MDSDRDVDTYIAGFPAEVAERLRGVREALRSQSPGASERISYGIVAVKPTSGHVLYFGGWKKHIGLYPVPELPPDLEDEVAPYRGAKSSLNFPHSQPLPLELIIRVAAANAG